MSVGFDRRQGHAGEYTAFRGRVIILLRRERRLARSLRQEHLLRRQGCAGKRGGTVLVASGDRDTFQLASERTTILFPVRAGEMARIGPAEVRERYGVDPEQVPDFIALRGDPSDRIRGARGVGPKGAADLLRRYGTLDGILASGLFPAQAEALRLYKEIATMDASAPLPSLASQKPTWDRAVALANEWGLNRLVERLGKLAETSS